MNDKEKRYLLLKAMSTEEAKETGLVHSQRADGYSKAVQALINSYGSTTIIYHISFRNLITRRHTHLINTAFVGCDNGIC